MSEFSGLNLALTALQSQRRGLELAAQNVANTNTDGYSRQRVDLESIGSPVVPSFYAGQSNTDGGVRVADITRFRDQFMEIQAALEHGAMGSLDVLNTKMTNIEQLFNEPSDSGIQSQLSAFWSSFDDVANHPGDTAARTQLLERATTLTNTFNQVSSALDQQRLNTQSELGATVSQINNDADQIAQLNKSIKAGTIAGLDVNDLLDKRDLLANKLAELSGGSIRSTDFGQVNVTVGGTAIVEGEHAQHVSLDTSGSPVVLRWTSTNAIVAATSGTAGGQLTALNSTIPGYISKLDNVATTLRDSVNFLHGAISGGLTTTAQNQSAAGNLSFDVSLDGGGFTTVTVAGADWSGAGGAAALQTALQSAIDAAVGGGNATATVTGGNGSPMQISVVPAGTHTLQVKATAGNNGFGTLLGTTAVGADGVGGRQFFAGTDAKSLTLSRDVAGNPDAVAAGTAANGPLDGSRALDLADLAQSQTGADGVYRQMIVQLGVDTDTAKSRADIQQTATQNLDNARQSNSGVNNDEEMAAMVQFQHAYEAAARFLTTIDSILDTLINHTGMTV
jgi:flagellar hook-associated protein 1 FlgK